MSKNKRPLSHRYPPLMEKLTPILLGVILLGMIVLIIIAIGVAVGLIG